MIKYYLENNNGLELSRGSAGAAGYDLRAVIHTSREINPGERWLIATGLYLEMPDGITGLICSRSGLAINYGVIVLNAPGVIDSDYRGEVKVSLINLGSQPYLINPYDKIAQLVFTETCVAFADGGFALMDRVGSRDQLSDTVRGHGGHGSTGR